MDRVALLHPLFESLRIVVEHSGLWMDPDDLRRKHAHHSRRTDDVRRPTYFFAADRFDRYTKARVKREAPPRKQFSAEALPPID